MDFLLTDVILGTDFMTKYAKSAKFAIWGTFSPQKA
ncbi:hypothetical protein T09_4228 [Trichinella sp. T9]|nr:hypothetical protein T09_4228 [Trichinella sp. T9]